MLSIVKEIGIFIVIAQAILYFVPGETYVKYVKVLIGVMMIAKMTSPVFSLLSGEGLEEIVLQGDAFWEEFADTQGDDFSKESPVAQERAWENAAYEDIYLGIGEEIKNKLNQNPAEGYVVEQAIITQAGEEYEITLSVARTIGTVEGKFSEKELEVYYEEILQTENVKVQING